MEQIPFKSIEGLSESLRPRNQETRTPRNQKPRNPNPKRNTKHLTGSFENWPGSTGEKNGHVCCIRGLFIG